MGFRVFRVRHHDDLVRLERLAMLVKNTSLCGLGQTSPNPILSTLQSFREVYEAAVSSEKDFVPDFDLAEATLEAARLTKRPPVFEETPHE